MVGGVVEGVVRVVDEREHDEEYRVNGQKSYSKKSQTDRSSAAETRDERLRLTYVDDKLHEIFLVEFTDAVVDPERQRWSTKVKKS